MCGCWWSLLRGRWERLDRNFFQDIFSEFGIHCRSEQNIHKQEINEQVDESSEHGDIDGDDDHSLTTKRRREVKTAGMGGEIGTLIVMVTGRLSQKDGEDESDTQRHKWFDESSTEYGFRQDS
jgi:hypothetical protein